MIHTVGRPNIHISPQKQRAGAWRVSFILYWGWADMAPGDSGNPGMRAQISLVSALKVGRVVFSMAP